MAEPHEVRCGLEQREEWRAEQGESMDLHALAEHIRAHCGHTQFKAYRIAAGYRRAEDAVAAFHRWTSDQGFSRSGMDPRSWQNWEAGGRPGAHYADLLSRFFSTNVVRLGFVADYSPALPRPESATEPAMTVPCLSPEELLTVCAQEASQYGAHLDTPIGAYTVEELESGLLDLARAYPHTPVIQSTLRARELRNRAWELRDRCKRTTQLAELQRIAGWLCAVLANASFDLGDLWAAQTHARVADLHGDLNDDHELRCWVAGLQALITYWDARPVDCVDYAQRALDFPERRGTARIRAASMKARGLALMGRTREMEEALHLTDELRDRAGDETMPGLLAFPVAKQHYWQASALVGTGEAERAAAAAEAAEAAVGLYTQAPEPARRFGELCHARLDLVTSRLLTGALDGIAEQVSPVLDSMHRRRIESVMRRLRLFEALLERPQLRTQPLVSAVREQVHDTLVSLPATVAAGEQ
ncbi:hypothetical protein [Salinactinospora qingdaonensis]|uniref:XRE family transcriptional regulator n=1 Tax=Salinactinospora qingdaonensis TaxID=702744 RepID=A0ABP7G7J4_9ACTN